MTTISVSVIIATYNRPVYVKLGLENMMKLTSKPYEIIVVDSSESDETKQIAAAYPGVIYLKHNNPYGTIPIARTIGLEAATGDVVAYIDDDAFPERDWLEQLVKPFSDPKVGAVGGRMVHNPLHMQFYSAEDNAIGRIYSNGVMSGNFEVDNGRDLEVDHVIGCNMAFRKSVIDQMGGLRWIYTGTCVREDADTCLRVKKFGYKVIYAPKAIVYHVGGPHLVGKRFDARYDFFSCRNHMIFLMSNYGLRLIVWRYFLGAFFGDIKEFFRKFFAAIVRMSAALFGVSVGFFMGFFYLLKNGTNPVIKNKKKFRAVNS